MNDAPCDPAKFENLLDVCGGDAKAAKWLFRILNLNGVSELRPQEWRDLGIMAQMAVNGDQPKACPFCGSSAEIEQHGPEEKRLFDVKCSALDGACGGRPMTDNFYSPTSAIEAWNRRFGGEV